MRADALLLRRLRLELLRSADAGIEADLWFSGLAESQGTDGFVFDAPAQSLLRQELAAEMLPDGRRALEAVWSITERLHDDWPDSLRIEERATWLALRGRPAAAADIDALLWPALKAMTESEQRGIEVARWALRAMPRLPDVARHTDSALALAIAAVARLGSGPLVLGPDLPRGLPFDLAWLLPPSMLAERQSCVIEPYADAFGLRAPRNGEAGGLHIELPPTRPLLLEVDCAVGSSRTVRLVAVEPGALVSLPEGWEQLVLRTLAGDRYRVRRTGAGVRPTSGLDWRTSVATMIDPHTGKPRGSALFVSRDHLVSVTSVLEPDSGKRSKRGEISERAAFKLRLADRTFSSTLVETDLDTSLVLLAATGSGTEPVPLPRRADDVAPGSDIVLIDAVHELTISGAVRAVEVRLTDNESAPHSRGPYLEIAAHGDMLDMAGWAGAPILLNGTVVGIADLGSQKRGATTVFAQPASRIARFIAWATRPAEHAVEVFVSHSSLLKPGEHWLHRGTPIVSPGPGGTRELTALLRIDKAMARAKLRCRPEGLVERGGGMAKDAGREIAACEAAVRVTIAGARSRDEHSRRELLLLAFRKWAKPDLPFVELTMNTRPDASLPPPLLGSSLRLDERLSLPAELRKRLDFARVATEPDDDALYREVRELLQEIAPDEADIDAALAALARNGLPSVLERAKRWAQRAKSQRPKDAPSWVQELAMLSLPADALSAVIDESATLERAQVIALDGTPAELLRLLLTRNRRSAPMPLIDRRDLLLRGAHRAEKLRSSVVEELTWILHCSLDEARSLIANPVARYAVLIEAGEDARNTASLLPGAVVFVLFPRSSIDRNEAAAQGMKFVKPLPGDEDMAFAMAYKQLLNIVAPPGNSKKSARRRNVAAKPGSSRRGR